MEFKALSHAAHQEMIEAAPAGEIKKTLGSSFFRGSDCNFNPYGTDQRKDDFAAHFLLKGWLPDAPFIDSATRVTTFGSCFAENISRHLASIGFDVSKNRAADIYISSMGEGLVNVHSIVQQFRWALEDWAPPGNLWHGYDAKAYDLSEDIRQKTREIFLATDVFILTFGLSEIWYDELTGGVFWRAVPMAHFDPDRHRFRVCSFAETKSCLDEIVALIRRHVPNARIVMTVSPIPLIATFRPVACITANSASKSIIRAAVDELMRENVETFGKQLFYFPAFDIVNESFPNRFVDDGRHLHPMIVPSIMKLFEAFYCRTGLDLRDVEAQFRSARLENVRTLLDHPLFGEALAPGPV